MYQTSSPLANTDERNLLFNQRQRRCHLKEERQRQRKEYRQMLKEKKSGLFQKEEVLALSTTSPNEGEDDDIDILV